MFSVIEGAVVGFVVGAFTPAVGRKIKSLFVKESKTVVGTLTVDVKNATANFEKKL